MIDPNPEATAEIHEAMRRAVDKAMESVGRRARECFEDALFLTPEDFDKKWPVEPTK